MAKAVSIQQHHKVAKPSKRKFRYVFSHRYDSNRETTITVLVFDVTG